MEKKKTEVFHSGSSKEGMSRHSKVIDARESYISYSGCDIIASVRLPKIKPDGSEEEIYAVLGSLQTVSISTYRDRAPVRAIGNINALDYVMGPRTIAGSLVFAVFDEHFADDILKKLGDYSRTVLVDELPAFDITITYANEYGSKSRMVIYGVRIIEEGQVISINDVYTENTYKYCALGLERLNKSKSGYSSPKKDNAPRILSEEYDENQDLTPGKDITDKIIGGDDSDERKGVSLYVDTEDAMEESEYGIAVFTLSPIQHDGFIYIYNLFGEIVKTIEVEDNDDSVYSTSLEIGSYTAQYKNETESKISNVVDFSIGKITTEGYSTNNEPLYIFSNKDKYVFQNNEHEYKEFEVYEGKVSPLEILIDKEGQSTLKIISAGDIKNNDTFSVSLPKDNEIYSIYTKKNNNYSNPKILKTNNKSMIEQFIEFVKRNSNILLNDISYYQDHFDFLEKNYDLNKNIIDNVLSLPKDSDRTELIYYAVIFQNLLIKSYNNNVLFFIKRNPEIPFFNSTIHNIVDSTVFLEHKYGKDYLVDSKNNVYLNTFNGNDDTRYSVYDIARNNIKSSRYDFVCFSPEEEYILNEYKRINVMKEINISNKLREKYNKLNNEEIIFANVKNFKEKNEDFLPAPGISYDYKTNVAKIDVNYKINKGLDNNKYYFVIKRIEEALDKYPATKIPFNGNDEIIEINYLNGYLYRNNVYIAWVEDFRLNQVSNPTIFSTDKNEKPWIKYIKDKDIEDKLKSIYNNILYKEKESMKFLSTNNIDLTIKNLKQKLLLEMKIELGNNIDAFEKIYELALVLFYSNYTSLSGINSVIVNKKDRTLIFGEIENEEFTIVRIDLQPDFTISESYFKTREISLPAYGYSIIYVIKNNSVPSDIIMIDNDNISYLSKLLVKVV